MKKYIALLLAAGFTLSAAQPALAAWQWIDNDGDGQEGCYYFTETGGLLTSATTPDHYRVNENGLWVVRGEVQTRAGKTYDMDAAIKEIRALYADTNNNPGQFRKQKGYTDPSSYITFDDQTAYFTASGVLAKRVLPRDDYSGLSTEVYYYRDGVTADGSYHPYMHLAFAFATDRSGNEYRIYFKDHRIIRYIGPDHVTVDFPGGASFISVVGKHSELNGGDKISSLLGEVDYGWWMDYEGEDNGYAMLTE